MIGPSLFLGSEAILPKTNGTADYSHFLPLYVFFKYSRKILLLFVNLFYFCFVLTD